jgi:hypothetical protein
MPDTMPRRPTLVITSRRPSPDGYRHANDDERDAVDLLPSARPTSHRRTKKPDDAPGQRPCFGSKRFACAL